MLKGRVKSFLVAAFSVLTLVFSVPALAQHENTNNDDHYEAGDEKSADHGGHSEGKEKSGTFDANEVIFGHVLDAHEYHFFSIGDFHATLPLPVIVYEPGRGWLMFMSSKFHHGEAAYEGYRLMTKHYKEHLKTQGMTDQQISLYQDEAIVAVNAQGQILNNVKVYDFSLTRNVVQMFLALAILIWIMTGVAKRYRAGQGVTSAPRGLQNAIEPVITFVRDEVAKPNIGHKYKRFMPLLLTIFFFILINNIFGLIPGSANVTGNIAFTAVLGLISFLVINFSGNKHYWGHIVNPPVPLGIKFIMVPVEILSIFTKPFALIVRLFANMLAGHIIIICLISLIFIFGNLSTVVGSVFAPVSIAFTVFIYVIEVLVAFIQAFIFTNLTAVFIGQAVEETHHGEEDHHQAPTEPVII